MIRCPPRLPQPLGPWAQTRHRPHRSRSDPAGFGCRDMFPTVSALPKTGGVLLVVSGHRGLCGVLLVTSNASGQEENGLHGFTFPRGLNSATAPLWELAQVL